MSDQQGPDFKKIIQLGRTQQIMGSDYLNFQESMNKRMAKYRWLVVALLGGAGLLALQFAKYF